MTIVPFSNGAYIIDYRLTNINRKFATIWFVASTRLADDSTEVFADDNIFSDFVLRRRYVT